MRLICEIIYIHINERLIQNMFINVDMIISNSNMSKRMIFKKNICNTCNKIVQNFVLIKRNHFIQ